MPQFHNGFSRNHMTCAWFSHIISFCVLERKCVNEPVQTVFIYDACFCVYAYESQRCIPTRYPRVTRDTKRYVKQKNLLLFIEAAFFFNAPVWRILPCSDVYKGNVQPVKTVRFFMEPTTWGF